MKLGIYGPITPEALEAYKKLNVNEVFISIDEAMESMVKQAKEEGFKVYICIWAFKALSEAYGVENIYGERKLWMNAGCPNNPILREHCLNRIKKALSSLEVDGVVLDGIRFPSPGSGISTFLTCFCNHCQEKAEKLNCNLAEIKHFLMKLKDPTLFIKASLTYPENLNPLSEWLRFRCYSITEMVKKVKLHLKDVNPEAKLGAAVFTPTLAPLVGQDYAGLASYLDFIQPMIYHKGDGIACINFELAKLVEEYSKSKLEEKRFLIEIYRETGFNGSLNNLIEKGLPIKIVSLEAIKGRRLVSGLKFTPIIFILNEDKAEIEKLKAEALKAELDGLVYFMYFKGLN